jgi:hypothetical protein
MFCSAGVEVERVDGARDGRQRFRRRAGIPLAPQQILALGLGAVALLGGGDERVPHLTDLGDVGGRRREWLAPSQGPGGRAQLRHRRDDAPGHQDRRHDTEPDREQRPAAVHEQRVEGADSTTAGGMPIRHRPARGRGAHVRPCRPRSPSSASVVPAPSEGLRSISALSPGAASCPRNSS